MATITNIDQRTAALTVTTDTSDTRLLDAAYAAKHLEHAYALTGHGALGATVEWAGVIGRPSEFTREWAYTSLSRARGHTRVYVVAEVTAGQRQREEYAPPEPERTQDEALDVLGRAMRVREAERLAIEAIEPQRLPTTRESPHLSVPLANLAEAGAESAAAELRSPSEARWPAPDHPGLERRQGSAREL